MKEEHDYILGFDGLLPEFWLEMGGLICKKKENVRTA
jgi:hypothetical protein